MLEYASKFMELFRFTSTFAADERLKMNCFEAELNPGIKERISMQQYASYMDLYNTAVNVEREMRERSNYFNEQCGIKRKRDQRKNFYPKVCTGGLSGIPTSTTMREEANTPTLG